MATFTVYLQGTSPTTVGATDKVKFAGAAGFNAKVAVGAYQGSTHVATSAGADKSTGNAPKNSKFISQSGGGGGDSQVDIGAGTVDLDTVTTGNCPIKINFSHTSSVEITDAIFYAYDGTTTTNAPTGVTFQAAEQGDANWTNAEGSASAVTLTDKSTDTSHDYFLLVSASPESVGLKEAFAMRLELTYS